MGVESRSLQVKVMCTGRAGVHRKSVMSLSPVGERSVLSSDLPLLLNFLLKMLELKIPQMFPLQAREGPEL